jgi:phenylpyruvate tautomerase PptA (4-oxalocrotonate tautomerase family)
MTTYAKYIYTSGMQITAPSYNSKDEIHVLLDGVETSNYTIGSNRVIIFNSTPAEGTVIVVYRKTIAQDINFQNKTIIRAVDLNTLEQQSKNLIEENADILALTLQKDSKSTDDNYTANNKKITDIAEPTEDGDAVNYKYLTDLYGTTASAAESAAEAEAAAADANHYAILSSTKAVESAGSAQDSANSATQALNYADSAVQAKNLAKTYSEIAEDYSLDAENYRDSAHQYMIQAQNWSDVSAAKAVEAGVRVDEAEHQVDLAADQVAIAKQHADEADDSRFLADGAAARAEVYANMSNNAREGAEEELKKIAGYTFTLDGLIEVISGLDGGDARSISLALDGGNVSSTMTDDYNSGDASATSWSIVYEGGGAI